MNEYQDSEEARYGEIPLNHRRTTLILIATTAAGLAAVIAAIVVDRNAHAGP